MTTLYLVRHGETEWNRIGRWQGHTDVELNDRGREQARELAARLADIAIDVIYSSDLKRAHETALIVAELKRMPVTTDVGLREIDVGSWAGLNDAEIEARFPDRKRPDGEAVDVFRARVVGAATRIARAHREQRVLIVSHGGTLRSLRRYADAPVAKVANCELHELRFVDERFVVAD